MKITFFLSFQKIIIEIGKKYYLIIVMDQDFKVQENNLLNIQIIKFILENIT